MMINRLIALSACLIFAATTSASARGIYRQPFYQNSPDKASATLRAGIVGANGSILYGGGFTVSHPETGEYDLSFPQGAFKKCPVFSITPAGTGSSAPLANIYGYSCTGSGVEITVLMIGIGNGQAEDNSFHFIATEP